MVGSAESLCSSCVGACCRANTSMNLSDDEAMQMINAGTGLSPMIPLKYVAFIDPSSGQTLGIDGQPIEDVKNISWDRLAGLYAKLCLISREVAKAEPQFAEIRDAVAAAAIYASRQQGYFILNSDCGNLDPNTHQCRIYDQRPGVCRAFEPGCDPCTKMREHHLDLLQIGRPRNDT